MVLLDALVVSETKIFEGREMLLGSFRRVNDTISSPDTKPEHWWRKLVNYINLILDLYSNFVDSERMKSEIGQNENDEGKLRKTIFFWNVEEREFIDSLNPNAWHALHIFDTGKLLRKVDLGMVNICVGI